MPNRRLIPDVIAPKSPPPTSPANSVHRACQTMAEHGAGAVIVTQDGTPGGRLIGIFTEHDVASRVIALGRDPTVTKVGSAMTRRPYALGGGSTARDALLFMQRHHCTHLPVTGNGAVIGLVSIKHLFEVINKQLMESISEVEEFVFGDSYSVHGHGHDHEPISMLNAYCV